MSRPANMMFPMRNQIIDLARNGMSMDQMTFVDKLNQAMTLGTAKRDGEEVTQSGVDTYSTMDKINRFYGVDPESQADANKIYLDAFSQYLDTDDIKKLVPQPDKALPYLAAGAALINSGTKGDDWGTALSNAFLVLVLCYLVLKIETV